MAVVREGCRESDDERGGMDGWAGGCVHDALGRTEQKVRKEDEGATSAGRIIERGRAMGNEEWERKKKEDVRRARME